MKHLYLIILVALFFLPQLVMAQCPPPGFPQPGNTCPQAPILCENLDGYCATINNNNTAQSFPGCPGWFLNNDEWFAFYAGSTSISIQVTPSNCSSGGMMGLQGGIYDGCGGPAMDLQCSCTQNPFVLSADNYIVGHIYWFVLDGCNGNVCDYSIDVLSGSTVGMPPEDPGTVTGPIEVCQNTSGSYSVPAIVGATSYMWTLTPANMGTLSVNNNNVTVNWGSTPGTATLCVKSSNQCFSNPMESCITVEVIPKPTATLSGGGILCAGSGGAVDLTVNFTGQGPWNFVYSINGTPQPAIQVTSSPYTLTVTQPGTYTPQSVSTVDGNCAGTVSGSAVVTLTDLNPSAVVTNSSCGQSNGAVNLSVTGGNTPYMFLWSNSAATEDLSNIPGGAYSVTITDEDGCSEVYNVNVPDNQVTLNVTGAVTANTTCNGGNGSIDVSVAPPPGNYTYLWSNSFTTQDLSGLPPGSYTITVTTGFTCTASATFDVLDQPNEPNATFTTTPTTCDQSNGSINLNVSGGVTPYTYLWSNTATTQNLSGIPAGAYSVTVTGANGCTDVANIDLTNNNPPITATANIAPNTTCNGNYNGSIDVSITPSGTYGYLWSNTFTTQDLSNLAPGSYSLTVTGLGSCSTTTDFTVPDVPNNPNANASTTPSTCDLSNGAINLTVTGGVSPYTYLWSNMATTQNINGLTAGNYSVTVTGANGCTDDVDVILINNNPPINVTANVQPNTTCNGNNNGSIDVSVTPNGAYTYTWSPPASTQDLTGLAPGSYSLTVSAGGTCTQTADFTVPDVPNAPVVNPSVTTSTCDLPNGGISLSVSGGVSPYTYLWSNNAITQNLTGLMTGDYSVTVTGANGCPAILSINVPNNNPPINLITNIVANTNCLSTGNGSIDLSVTPPAGYTYIWSNMATTQDISNLAPGIYQVTVSAGGSCTETDAFVVPDNPNTPNLSFSTTSANCGLNNGAINLTVTGGTGPYTYIWSNMATTQDLSGIPGDIYVVTVTGSNGCTEVDGVAVDDYQVPISLDGFVTPQTSCLTNNGAINLVLSPSNLSVMWSNLATTANISNLAPGDYSVTVSAGGTCTETTTFTVDNLIEYPDLTTDVSAAFCNLPNGMIDLQVNGGQTPYQYHWSNNSSNQDLTNLSAADYAVTVTTALGCTAETFVTVPANTLAISPNGVASDNTSCTTPNGYIDLDVQPPYNYTYNWSNNLHTADLNNIPAGTYSVTIVLGTCSETASYDILNAAVLPNLSAVGIPATCGLSNGGTNATVSGATPPYTYHWSNSMTTEDLSGLAPNTYALTVSDFWGCTATTSVNVVNNNLVLNITGTPQENTSCVTPNGTLDISVSPSGAYTYAWSNMLATEDLAGLPAGNYTVTVSSGLSCSSTATFAVGNNTPNPALSGAVTAAICSNSNGAIDLNASGAAMPFSYLWSNMAVTEDLTAILPGPYTVTVTAANGCTSDTTFVVPNNSSTFSLSGTIAPLTDCATNNGAIDLTVTPAGPYTYLWSNSMTTQDLSGLAPGAYDVSVTETGSCVASISFIVVDARTYPALAQSITPEICGLSNGAVDLSTTGGTPPYTYQWLGGPSSEDLTAIPDGNYAVTVTDANHCTATASMNVPENSIGFSVGGTSANNTSCISDNGQIDLTLTPADPGNGLTYNYLWSQSSMSQDLSGLSPGAYSVTVSVGNTCTGTAAFNIGNAAEPPTLTEAITPAFCGQNSGAIDLSVSGGQAPYVFAWSDLSGNEDVSGLPSGDYSVTVTGANGCVETAALTIPENVTIPSISGSVTANSSCVSGNGAIAVTVSPALTYSYVWSNSLQTEDLTSLAAGAYTLTVSAGGACTAEASFNVPNDLSPVALSGAVSDVLCYSAATGAVDVTVNSGVAPFGFNWSPAAPGNPEDLTGLASGAYSLTVTDAMGCTSTAVYTIAQPSTAVQVACNQTNTVSAPGATDGAGSVSLTGGTPPYEVTVSPGGTQSGIFPGNTTFSNLAEGSYAVSVTDANGCTTTCGFNIGLISCSTAVGTMQNTLVSHCGTGCVTASYNSFGQFLENGDVLQFILHTGTGNQIQNEIARNSQPEFCFNAALMSYGVTYYISAVAGNNDGTGNVVLSDFCTVVSLGTPVVFRQIPVAAIAPPEALSCAVKEVVLSGSSDLPGVSYQWTASPGQIMGSASQPDATATAAGNYRLVISLNGCADTVSTNVIDISNELKATIYASPDDILDCTIDEIILSGVSEGSVNVNAIWISNGNTYTPGTVLQIDEPGTYQFVILDTLSFCSDTATLVINQDLAYPPLFINPPATLTCAHPVATLNGGSPVPGIQFVWASLSGADTTVLGSGTTLSVNAPGTYLLIGTDPLNNCKNGLATTVTADQVLPVAEAGEPFSMDCYGAQASLDGSASSGAGALNFNWTTTDGLLLSGASTATPLIGEPGTYVLLVTNPSNGCMDTDNVLISPLSPHVSASVQQPPCYGDKGAIRIDSVQGGKPPVQFSLDNGQHFSSQTYFNNLIPSTYTLLVQDAEGCSTTLSLDVIAAEEFLLEIDPQVTVLLGDTYQFDVQISIASPDTLASVSWTPSTWLSCDDCLDPVATPFLTTRYEVVAVTGNGCTDRAPVQLIVDRGVDVYIPNIFSPDQDGHNDYFTVFADPLRVPKVKSLQVFSRWGELVYELYDFVPNNPSQGWDGKLRGQPMNPAVFVWYCVVEFVDGTEHLYKGDVTLER